MSVPGLGLAAARGGGVAHAVRQRAAPPGDRQAARSTAPTESGPRRAEVDQQVDDLVGRGAVGAREARAVDHLRVDAEQRGDRPAHDGGAGGGRAGAAEAGAELLQEHLGEEVVGRRQRQAEQLRPWWASATLRQLRRARRRASRRRCRRGPVTPSRLQRAPAARGPRRRPARGRRASVAALAAVEGQRAERAFQEGVGRVVAGGLAAQRVEVGLVALDRAGDAVDAVGLDELVDQRRDARADAAVVGADEGAAAERRVAAAAQVEAAVPDAAGREVADAVARSSDRRAVGPIRSSAVVAV